MAPAPRRISACLACRTQSTSSEEGLRGGDSRRQLSGTGTIVDGRSSERLSAATLESLRTAVHSSSSKGDVRDVYRFGRTLGARPSALPLRVGLSPRATQAPAATPSSKWRSTGRRGWRWR